MRPKSVSTVGLRQLVDEGQLDAALTGYTDALASGGLDEIGRRIALNAINRLVAPGPTGQRAAIPPRRDRDDFLTSAREHLSPSANTPYACPTCLRPRRQALGNPCQACGELWARYDRVFSTIEFICMDGSSGPTHTLVRHAKDARNPWALRVLAAAWSAYWDTHRGRIHHPDCLLLRAPSRHPLLDWISAVAARNGWPTPAYEPAGPPCHGHANRYASRDERMTRSPEDWTITVDVAGRNVVLLDDVFTTGATAWSLGRALKGAGAKTVKLLAFEHCVPGGVLAEFRLGAWDAGVRRTSGGR